MTDLSEIPNIIAFIRNAWPVSDSTLRRLAELIVRKDFPRRGIIVGANTQCGRAYFIEDGMTRSYWLVDGEEFTTSFSTEGSIVLRIAKRRICRGRRPGESIFHRYTQAYGNDRHRPRTMQLVEEDTSG